MKLITPAALNSKYNELHSIIREDLMHTQASKPKSEVSDYNKIVQSLHEEAFKDALMSKKAKQEKLVKRQERRVMKMQK